MPHELDRWVRRKVRRRNDERPRTRRGGCGAHHEVDGGAPPPKDLVFAPLFSHRFFFFLFATRQEGDFKCRRGGIGWRNRALERTRVECWR